MKKILLAVFILTLLSFDARAQELHLGAKLGLNLSTITGDFTESNDPRLAYHFGVFTNIKISDKFSINPELLYLSIGNTYNINLDNFQSFDNPTVNLNSTLRSAERANFLAVPIIFRFDFTNRFGLDFGPQVGFLLNTVSKVKETPDNIDAFDQKFSGNFKPDYGANLGFTVSPNEKLIIQLDIIKGLKT